MGGDDGDAGSPVGPRETLAGVVIMSMLSTYILASDLPLVDLINQHELAVWAVGGMGTAIAIMVLWVQQTNREHGSR